MSSFDDSNGGSLREDADEDPNLENIAVRSVGMVWRNEAMIPRLRDDVNQAVQMDSIAPEGIGPLDALKGRGGHLNGYIGNILYRQLVLQYRDEYRSLSFNRDKQNLVWAIVWSWRSFGGRYLEPERRDGDGNVIFWRDIGNRAMAETTKQLFRL